VISSYKSVSNREFLYTSWKIRWILEFNVRLRHGIFRSWIITEFMYYKQTWMHLISSCSYIIGKNLYFVTFFIQLHIHIGGRRSFVLVVHATSRKTKSLCCQGRDHMGGPFNEWAVNWIALPIIRLERHCRMMARGKVHSEMTRPENDCDLKSGLGYSNLIIVQNWTDARRSGSPCICSPK
jgi:hypothetical protein